MTLQTARLRLNTPTLKLASQLRLPTTILGENFIEVTRDGGVYTITADYTKLADTPFSDPDTVYIAILDTTDGSYKISTLTELISGVPGLVNSGVEFMMDGGGSTLPTGFQGVMEIPFPCSISRSTLMASAVGNLQMDVFKTTASAPTGGASIVAAAPPTLTAAQFAQDSTLTGWSKTLAAGDVLAFYVNGTPTVSKATLSLLLTRT